MGVALHFDQDDIMRLESIIAQIQTKSRPRFIHNHNIESRDLYSITKLLRSRGHADDKVHMVGLSRFSLPRATIS